jgi:hypothetical protein
VAGPPAEGPEGEGEVTIASTVSSKISYQGVLKENDQPVTGSRDMTFRLYSDSACTTQVGSDIVKSGVQVTNGLFSVELDVTHSHFNGRGLWLKVFVDGTGLGCEEILPVPYALSLRPGADIVGSVSGFSILYARNESSTDRSKGVYGHAPADSGETYGVYGLSDSSEGYGVYGENTASGGVALKAGGSGIIQSTADSYIFIPGNEFIKNVDTDTTRWDCQANGSVKIWRGATAGHKYIYIPITLPGVLYGQEVEVKSITVYYKCEDGSQNYITETWLHKQTDADSLVTLVENYTNRTSNTATSYTLDVNHTLSSDTGILGLNLKLEFADDTNYIQIGGVRVRLGHD